MQKTFSILLPLFFCCLLPLSLFAQQGVPERVGGNIHRGPNMHALENNAKKSYAEGNYFLAMQYYERMLENDSLDLSALEGLADAAIAYTNYHKAAETYAYLLQQGLWQEGDASSLLRRAKVQYLLGNYGEAKRLYQRPEDWQSSAEALQGIEDCEWAESKGDRIALDQVGKEVNTRYAEYANVWDNGTFYYSSYSHPYKGDSSRLIMQILELRVNQDSSLFIRPSSFNEKDKHTAYLTFNTDKTAVYYAVGDYSKDKRIKFELYRRQRVGDGDWGPAEKLPAIINQPGFSTTQPHVCRLPGALEETLFFVSDRPGGEKKKDIWYAQIEQGGFKEPLNLSDLNTDGDDVTPFYLDSTQTLYFSSNGRQGLGGFDVYSSVYSKKGWASPEHLPEDINSNANDVFYSIYQLPHVAQIAFFSSNRYGEYNESEEECCYDIYKYRRPILYLCNQEVGVALKEASITLLELTSTGPVELSRLILPGDTHPLPLLPGKSYLLITSKDGFHTDTFKFDTPQKIWDQQLTIERCLRPANVNLIVEVLEVLGGDTLRPLPGATVLFKTLAHKLPNGKIDRGPDNQGLAALNNTLPEDKNVIRYDSLLFEHDYGLKAFKLGYTSDAADFSTINLNKDTTIRKELKLRRGFVLDVYVFDDLKREPLNEVNIKLIEITTATHWEHKTGPDANDYHTIIHYDRRYRVIASKDGYSKDSVEFRTDERVRVPFDTIIQNLYLRPMSLQAYLPITLYFDNDEPGPHTRRDTCITQEYRQTYVAYYQKKETFINNFVAPLSGIERDTESFKLDTFFENQVKGGWNRLMKFSEVLYEMLGDDNIQEITIEIRGYASPLANAEYNRSLTSRRVLSVINHFYIFDGGIYKKYIDPELNNICFKDKIYKELKPTDLKKLKLKRVPNGSSQAPKSVSANPKDRRHSVYSLDASRERRVEIVGVDVNGNIIPELLPQK